MYIYSAADFSSDFDFHQLRRELKQIGENERSQFIR